MKKKTKAQTPQELLEAEGFKSETMKQIERRIKRQEKLEKSISKYRESRKKAKIQREKRLKKIVKRRKITKKKILGLIKKQYLSSSLKRKNKFSKLLTTKVKNNDEEKPCYVFLRIPTEFLINLSPLDARSYLEDKFKKIGYVIQPHRIGDMSLNMLKNYSSDEMIKEISTIYGKAYYQNPEIKIVGFGFLRGDYMKYRKAVFPKRKKRK